MTTPRTRAIVSLAAALTLMLAFGACARQQSRPALEGLATTERRPFAIRFDNNASERVHVYLIAEQRQWLLGRVEPGARVTLQVPEASLVGSQGSVQLAVLTGERITLNVARDPRAMLTVSQPASAILSQRWAFTQGQLTSLGARVEFR